MDDYSEQDKAIDEAIKKALGARRPFQPMLPFPDVDPDETLDPDAVLSQEEIDELLKDLSDNPFSPMPTPVDDGLTFPDHPIIPSSTCPDCKGTGEYRGLEVVEPCGRCHGVGRV